MTNIELIRRTIALYSLLLDDSRYEEWGELFAVDAVFLSLPGIHGHGGAKTSPQPLNGRAAIVTSTREINRRLRKDGQVLHFGGPALIDVVGNTATAWWDFIVLHVRADSIAPIHTGRYYAKFLKHAGEWRFTERVSVQSGGVVPSGLAAVPPR